MLFDRIKGSFSQTMQANKTLPIPSPWWLSLEQQIKDFKLSRGGPVPSQMTSLGNAEKKKSVRNFVMLCMEKKIITTKIFTKGLVIFMTVQNTMYMYFMQTAKQVN